MINKKTRANKRRARAAVRTLNKSLREDVFKDRFSARIVARRDYRYEDHSGVLSFYAVEFLDKEEPQRNMKKRYSQHNITVASAGYERTLWRDMNDFIVTSDFWRKEDEAA